MLQDVKRCMEAAKRLGGLTTQSSDTDTEINGLRSHGRTAAFHSVKLEDTSAEPQLELKKREEHLHGSGWQDPICGLFQKGSGWHDPICALFQTKSLATCQAENREASGSYSLDTPPETSFKGSDASSKRVNLRNGGCVDSAVKEKELRVAAKSSTVYPEHE